MGVEELWTKSRADRIRTHTPEWTRLKGDIHESIGNSVGSAFMSVVHLASAPATMLLPRVNPKAPGGKMIQFDPVGRLGEKMGKSGAHALNVLYSLGICTGKTTLLALRRGLAL